MERIYLPSLKFG